MTANPLYIPRANQKSFADADRAYAESINPGIGNTYRSPVGEDGRINKWIQSENYSPASVPGAAFREYEKYQGAERKNYDYITSRIEGLFGNFLGNVEDDYKEYSGSILGKNFMSRS
jgi:hypothetical protein